MLSFLALSLSSGAFAGADKPLVIESGQVRQLPANTTLQTNASVTGAASLNMPHGTAPASPVNGDCWTTTAGLFCRINGSTVGPMGSGGGVTATGSPASGNLAEFSGSSSITNGDLSGDCTTAGTLAVACHNVTSSAHGMAPIAPADATKFLNGATTPSWAAVKDSDLSISNVTTNDVSTARHGFAPLLPNDATKFLNGTGAYTVPPGSGGGGGTGAWWNFALGASSSFTHSFVTTGNLFLVQQNITIYEASVLLTTVNSAAYKIGLAPFNTGTKQITSAPTYTPAITIGSSAGAANSWVRGYFSGGFACATGTTYVIFIARTDSTATVSTTLNDNTPAVAAVSPSIYATATNGSVHLASTGPTTSDIWSTESGFYILDFAYQFT